MIKIKYLFMCMFLSSSVAFGGNTFSYIYTSKSKKELGLELIEAVKIADIYNVKNLIRASADFYLQDEYGMTALMFACLIGNIEIVKLLIDAKVPLDMSDKHGKTALMISSGEDDEDIVKLLIQFGANIDLKDNDGQTALMIAQKNDSKNIIELLESGKKNKNMLLGLKLIRAIIYGSLGNINNVKYLLEDGADVNVLDNHGRTPLMYAAMYNSFGSKDRIIDLLIKNSADINMQDKNGNTALMLACNEANIYSVEALLEHDPDINIKNIEGQTALNIAVKKHWPNSAFAIGEHLIKKIIKAFESNDLKTIKNLLIIHGNFKNSKGDNLLHVAAKSRNYQMFKYIFASNPKLIIEKNSANQTPIVINPEMLIHLILSADIYHKDDIRALKKN